MKEKTIMILLILFAVGFSIGLPTILVIAFGAEWLVGLIAGSLLVAFVWGGALLSG